MTSQPVRGAGGGSDRPKPTRAAQQPPGRRRDARGSDDEARWANDVVLAMGDLERIARQALQLIYGRDYTQAQVAAELMLPEPTVRRCVAYGMRELAARLTAGGPPGAPHCPAGVTT